MANEVFANGREIACKSGSAKVIASFPDVCFTLPQTPATPPGIPIPYPVTSMSSDTTKGSRTVKINRKEVMLRNRSFYKKCTGDEAGNAPKKGIITSSHRSKTYFRAWSMNVKIENKNVVRHFDITTSNHRSEGPNAAIPNINTEGVATPKFENCDDYVEEEQKACRNAPPVYKKNSKGKDVQDGVDCSSSPGCEEAKACIMVAKNNDKSFCCSPNTTGHHMIEDQWVKENPGFPWYRSLRVKGNKSPKPQERQQGIRTDEDAPTVCVNAPRSVGSPHRNMHDVQGYVVEVFQEGGALCDPSHPSNGFDYGAAKKAALDAHDSTFPTAVCNRDCLEKQLDEFYRAEDDQPLNLPEERQGLGDERDRVDSHWRSVVTGEVEPLTQNLGEIMKRSGVI